MAATSTSTFSIRSCPSGPDISPPFPSLEPSLAVGAFGTICQSRVTSPIGTGIYFLASIGIIFASWLSGSAGISITGKSAVDNGMAIPAIFVVTLASLKRSFRATDIFSVSKTAACPTEKPA